MVSASKPHINRQQHDIPTSNKTLTMVSFFLRRFQFRRCLKQTRFRYHHSSPRWTIWSVVLMIGDGTVEIGCCWKSGVDGGPTTHCRWIWLINCLRYRIVPLLILLMLLHLLNLQWQCQGWWYGWRLFFDLQTIKCIASTNSILSSWLSTTGSSYRPYFCICGSNVCDQSLLLNNATDTYVPVGSYCTWLGK